MTDRIETKAQITVTEEGAIEGVAWLFSDPDRVGDMIGKGAITAPKTLPMLFGHDQTQVTPAEKQKAYRERQIAEHRAALDISLTYLKRTFAEFAVSDLSDFEMPLGLAGIQPPTFEDERDPIEFADADAIANVDNPFPGAKGSVGRAEITIDCLIDAAIELACKLNAYKRAEISARVAELETSETLNSAEIMQEAAKLSKIMDQLDKQVRRNFPQWKVTGV